MAGTGRNRVERLPLRDRTTWVGRLPSPLQTFMATEAAGATLLLATVVVALAWSNSPFASSYEAVWSTEVAVKVAGHELALSLRELINDGLMTFFFFVIGLEIRRELDMGELRERRRVALPVLAAIGGMAVPALLYVAINAGHAGTHGWGVVMATDTALALGWLGLVGPPSSHRIRAFLLTMVIFDDIGALIVIAVFYSSGVAVLPLVVSAAFFAGMLALRYLRVWRGPAYFLLGVGLWVAMHGSGVHPTIAGVAIGLLAPAYPPPPEDLARATQLARTFREQPTPDIAHHAWLGVMAAISPNERIQYLLHPWTSFLVVPLFALANAGIHLDGHLLAQSFTSPITWGIVVGLVAGKAVGVTAASGLATLRGMLPMTVDWPSLAGVAATAGIGFTVSLFIADLSFTGDTLAEAKVGILTASVVAALLASAVFRVGERLPERLARRLRGRPSEPLVDLALPVDPERDHLRGPREATLTLVEYGDYECPYCGQAESVLRELLAEFGGELRYVFRHLPLVDVHPHAEMAAEAAEAAGAQGRFWEMHDLLFSHQDALEVRDLLRYARELELDVERFDRELRERDHAARVGADLASAEDSGAPGTPTFFLNGQRLPGPYDIATLQRAVLAARDAARARG